MWRAEEIGQAVRYPRVAFGSAIAFDEKSLVRVNLAIRPMLARANNFETMHEVGEQDF